MASCFTSFQIIEAVVEKLEENHSDSPDCINVLDITLHDLENFTKNFSDLVKSNVDLNEN
jgi:hypothetical protein